jgi:hypothetical protein
VAAKVPSAETRANVPSPGEARQHVTTTRDDFEERHRRVNAPTPGRGSAAIISKPVSPLLATFVGGARTPALTRAAPTQGQAAPLRHAVR